MKAKAKARALLIVGIPVLLLAGVAGVWVVFHEPRYDGRPVTYWATHHSPELYPKGTVPRMPSRKGLEALHEMGAEKAALALMLTVSEEESRFSLWYRAIHPRLPTPLQRHFPLGLRHGDRRQMALGAAAYFDSDYQRRLVPFVVKHLKGRSHLRQRAACQLLAQMPDVAEAALPALEQLTRSEDPEVRKAAQSAWNRIGDRTNVR